MADKKALQTTDLEEKETEKDAIVELRKQDWYKALIEDLKSQLVETQFNVNNTLIELYHSIGHQISERTDNFTRSKVYGSGLVQTIASDLERNSRTISRAMLFYKKFPDLKQYLGEKEKNWSWTKTIRQDLPESTEKTETPNQEKIVVRPSITFTLVEKELDEETEDGKPVIQKLYKIHLDEDQFINIDWSEIKDSLCNFWGVR